MTTYSCDSLDKLIEKVQLLKLECPNVQKGNKNSIRRTRVALAAIGKECVQVRKDLQEIAKSVPVKSRKKKTSDHVSGHSNLSEGKKEPAAETVADKESKANA